MSQNTQNPYFYTLDASIPDILEVVGATSLSIFADTDACQIDNMETGQQIIIPIGTSLDLNPDSGNTLATLRIQPYLIAYVVMIGGTAQLV